MILISIINFHLHFITTDDNAIVIIEIDDYGRNSGQLGTW